MSHLHLEAPYLGVVICANCGEVGECYVIKGAPMCATCRWGD